VLPFVWANNSGVRQLAWLRRNGTALADGTHMLALALNKAEATLAGLGAQVNPKAKDSEAFNRGVRFGKTGWDAAADKQFVAGRVWRFTGNVPGTVTERRPRRPMPSSAPTTPRRRRRRRRGARERGKHRVQSVIGRLSLPTCPQMLTSTSGARTSPSASEPPRSA
jgi:hypothetical protein